MLRRPLAKLQPSPFIYWEKRAALAPFAEDVLLRLAEVLVEGRVTSDATGQTFFGSVFFAIDLNKHAQGLVPSDMAIHVCVATLQQSVQFRLLCMRRALQEARTRCPGQGQVYGQATTQTRVRFEQGVLLVDVDVELPLTQSMQGTA